MSCICLILTFSLCQSGTSESRLEELVSNKKTGELAGILKQDRAKLETYFQSELDSLLEARLENEPKAKQLEKKLTYLSGIFARELQEDYPRLFLKRFLSWSESQIEEKKKADRKLGRAQSLFEDNKYNEAIETVRDAAAICRRLSYTTGLIQAEFLKGRFSWVQKKSEAAEEHLLSALSAAERVSYDVALPRILSPLGLIYLRQGKHEEAGKVFKKNLSVFRELGDRKGESWTLGSLGRVALETGRLGEALSLYRKALSIPGRAKNADGRLYKGIGRAFSERRNYLEAYRAFEKAFSHAGDPDLKARILVNLAGLWRRQGDLERAERTLLEALKQAQIRGKGSQVAAIQNNLANIYQIKEEFTKARSLYREALSVEKELGDLVMVGRILTNLTLVAWEEDKGERAGQLYREAFKVLKRVGDRPPQAELLKERGFFMLSKGKCGEARRLFREALQIYKKLRDTNGLIHSYMGLGKASLSDGEDKEACRYFSDALEHLERQRKRVSSGRFRDLFLNKEEFGEIFGILAGVLIDLGRLEDAFKVAEKAKARGLSAEMLCQGEAAEQIPLELRKKREELAAGQAFLRRKLEKAEGKSYEKYQRQFDLNERRRSILEEGIWARFPRNRPHDVSSAEDVMEALPSGTLLLEYLLGPERSFLFSVTQNKVQVVTLPGEEGIKKVTAKLLSLCRSPLSSPAKQAEKTAGILLRGVSKEINSAERLLVVPHGVLQGLPFGILKEGDRYLIERVPIAYLPSASIALQTKERAKPEREAGQGVFVFGDPVYEGERVLDPRLGWGRLKLPGLKGSAVEAKKVAEALDGKLFLGKSATESALKKVLPKAGYIHLAVHSIVHPRRSELCSIILSSDDENDGIMEVREISETSSRLTVLSACKSGLGKEARGEGFLGLGRALLEAGARRVVLSYWNVHDRSACKIMPVFWRSFLESKDGSKALRKAKLSFLENARKGRYSLEGPWERGRFQRAKKEFNVKHPFFWGGFVMITTEVNQCFGH